MNKLSTVLLTATLSLLIYNKWVDENLAVPSPISSSEPTAIPTQTKVVMYATEWCPYCRQARNYFKKMGIAFTEYDVEKDVERMREFKELGGKGYPLLIIGGDQKIHGFDEAHFQQLYQQQSE